MRRTRCVALAALVLGTAVSATAHTRSVSYSSWKLDADGARVELRVPLLELSRLALDPAVDVQSDGPAARYLASHLQLERGGEPCALAEPPVAGAAPKGWVHFAWSVRCAASGAQVLESRILLAEAPSHLHFARVERPGSGAVERLLTEGETRWELSPGGSPPRGGAEGTSLGSYVALGVEHILSGWDHLAFVFALLLLAARLGEVASLVTAFTVAHSVTLALAVLGLVRPEGAAVEAVIGFSIALVAAENAWLESGRGRVVPLATVAALAVLAGLRLLGIGVLSVATLLGLALFSACHFGLLARVSRPARLRAAVAFAFGLVHGFGFAGVLAEMALPNDRLVPALFGFNVGVELGQLAIVALFWPLLGWLRRASPTRWHPGLVDVATAGIAGLGVYWFFSRTLG